MKRLIIVFSFILFLVTSFVGYRYIEKRRESQLEKSLDSSKNKSISKKRVIVFTSNIGGGHKSPTDAIYKALHKSYDVKVVNFAKEITEEIEPIAKLTKGYHNSEEFFSFIAKNGWNNLANMISDIAIKEINSKKIEKKLFDKISALLKQEKPDVVISVIGLVNYPIARATNNLKIPFIIVPTDLDQTIATNGFAAAIKPSKIEKFPYLTYAISIDHPDINKTLIPFALDDEQIIPVGFPLRKQFYKRKNVKKIKQSWNIPNNKKVVLLLIGGLGGNSTANWAETLKSYDEPIHVIACCGKNESLKQKLKEFKNEKEFSLSVVGYTDQISDLMNVSDSIIIKPGTNSVVEAILSKKQVIIDATQSEPLNIEKFNCHFIIDNDLGYVVTKKSDVISLLKKKNIASKQNLFKRQFSKKIKPLVDCCLSKKK
jgi:processive 1,2-diacylglycerol beta-glucosyltransferase